MNMLKRSRNLNVKNMLTDNSKFEEGYLYYSFRPLWLQLIEEIKKNTNLTVEPLNSMLGGSFIRCKGHIPLETIINNELLVANENSFSAVIGEFLSQNGAMVLVKQDNTKRYVILDVNGMMHVEEYNKIPNADHLTLDDSMKYRYHFKDSDTHQDALKHVLRIINEGFDRDISWLNSLAYRLDFMQEGRVMYAQIRAEQQQGGTDFRTVVKEKLKEGTNTLQRVFKIWKNIAEDFNQSEAFNSHEEVLAEQLAVIQSIESTYMPKESNTVSQEKIVQWADLDTYGIFLGEQKFSDNKDRLMLVDISDYIKNNDCKTALKEIGFVPVKGQSRFEEGVYVLKSNEQILRPSALAKALKLDRCPLKQISISEIPIIFKEKAFKRFELNLNNIALRSEYLGLNAKNQKVFRGEMGRFIRVSPILTYEEPAEPGADFLYANSGVELRQCAEGFVLDIINGERKNWNDVKKFGQVIFNSEDVSDAQLHKLQEGIEAAAYRVFITQAKAVNNEQYFSLAQNVYFGLPVAKMRTAQSVALQQFSTPLPLSVIAQKILVGHDTGLSEKTLLEPTAGNGGLLFNLETKKSLVELDAERFRALKESLPDAEVLHGDATTLDFAQNFNNPEGFDYVISNPPFGKMETPKGFFPLPKVTRLDHYIALRALASRKTGGRAVLILGADSAQSDGSIKGSTRNVMNYLYDYYDVHSAVEVDGRLYSRQGAGYNVRILVIGDRRLAPVTSNVPEKLPLLHNYEQLWQWSEDCIAKYPVQVIAETVTHEIDTPTVDTPVGRRSARTTPTKTPAASRSKRVIEQPAEKVIPDTSLTTQTVENAPDQTQKSPSQMVIEIRNVNEFQTPYVSMSKVGEPSTMIPINMSAAAYSAIDKMVSKVGDVDIYVANKLNYPLDRLGDYFSSEQIDAIALGINAIEENRGMINADQTGIGKGRYVAAMLRYARLNNKRPVFLTIKPELFTDIFRDIKDIGSEDLFKKVFIFNNNVDVKVYGSEYEVLRPSIPALVLNEALSKGEVGPEYDLVMSTYSQFQRERSKNKKSELILSITDENTMLILDESHVAAGASQIAEIVSDCVGKSGGVIYASATPIKGVKNFALYSKCFPPSVDTMLLPETLAVGGESLQEAISTNMAMDGSIIRREHDYSKLTFTTRFPDAEMEQRNRELMDIVAGILSEMSYLSGDVSKVVKSINESEKDEWESIPLELRDGNRMNASSMNFGSRLYNITRQFLLGCKTELVIKDAIDAIEAGRKPVVAVENTGEMLLKSLIAIRSGAADIEEELDFLESQNELSGEQQARKIALEKQLDEVSSNVMLDTTPQFRDLLEIMLDRIATIKIVGRYGDVTTKNAAEDEEYFDAQEDLREKIKGLPDLPLSPIDEFRAALTAKGYRVDEVSGRKTSLVPVVVDGKKMWRVETHSKADAVANVAAFQNGKLDAIVITRSGSTGISLHATNRFKDSDARQRQFIVWQKAGNIAEFLQWMGRVNRKDQVCSPLISNIESGLPAESRQTMMHNAKLRKLSANTTSNRENENLEGDIDLLNSVGDLIALNYLRENPDIASDLDIKLPKDGEVSSYMSEHPFINKLMGRLMMVNVGQQEAIISALVESYKSKMEEYDQANTNPFKVAVFDWAATVIKEEVMVNAGVMTSDSSFDDPVKIVTVQYEKNIEPIRFEKLTSMLKINSENTYCQKNKLSEMIMVEPDHFLDEKLTSLKDNQFKYVKSFLSSKHKKGIMSLDDIRDLKDAEGATQATHNSDFIIDNIKNMKIGRHVEVSDPETGVSSVAVIADIEFPYYEKDIFHMSKYRFYLAIPGKERLQTISLAVLKNTEVSLQYPRRVNIDYRKAVDDYSWLEKRQLEATVKEFNNAIGGKITFQRNTLEGNIFRASELAAQHDIGYPALYTDQAGDRKRAIIVKAAFSATDIKEMPVPLNATSTKAYVEKWLEKYGDNQGSSIKLELSNSPLKEKNKDFIRISYINIHGNKDFRVWVSGGKSSNNGLIVNERIFNTGKGDQDNSLFIELTGNRREMVANISVEDFPEFCNRLFEGKHIGKFYLSNINDEIMKALSEHRNKHAATTGCSNENSLTL